MNVSTGRPSAAMIVACIALVLAMAGSAVAGKGDRIGAKGLKQIAHRTATVVVPQGGQYAEATAKCKKKEKMTGGGATINNEADNEFIQILENGPAGKKSWTARAQNAYVVDRTLTVTSLCLKK